MAVVFDSQRVSGNAVFAAQVYEASGTTAVTSDATASYAIRAPITSDLSASYTILTAGAVTSDCSASYGIRAAVQASLGASYSILGTGVTYWPLPSQVLAGVTYGPTGSEYTGTATAGSYPTAADIAAAVWAHTQ